MENPLISFIIIEFHSIPDVLKCVKHIEYNIQSFTFEIIISSNSLYDINQKTQLLSKYPDIVWLFNSINGGFAYGMNCGLEKAKGMYAIFQNPDTKIIKGLENAICYMQSHPEVGILGPKILNNEGAIQDSSRSFMTPLKLIIRVLIRYLLKRNSILDSNRDYEKVQSVDWVIGAFMISPKELITSIGGFDETYFMYVEDMDLCLRMWNCGKQVIYFPILCVEYEGDRKSSAIVSKSVLKINKYTLIHIKNYLMFLRKQGKYVRVPKFKRFTSVW